MLNSFFHVVYIARALFVNYVKTNNSEVAKRISTNLSVIPCRGLVEVAVASILLERQVAFFLQSEAYSNWCKNQLDDNLSISESANLLKFVFTPLNIAKDAILNVSDVLTTFEIQLYAMKFNSSRDEWLVNLILLMETANVCVFFSLPCMKSNYPIVYANPCAGNILRTNRFELLGHHNPLFNSNSNCSTDSIRLDIQNGIRTSNVSIFNPEDSIPIGALSKPIYDIESTFRLILTVFTPDGSNEGINRVIACISNVPNFCY